MNSTYTIGNKTVNGTVAGLGVTAVLQAVVVVWSGSVALLGDTLHNIADARLEIEDVLVARRSGGAEAGPAQTDRPPKGVPPREVAAWSVAALAVTALIAGAWLVTSGPWGRREGAEPPPVRLSARNRLSA